MKDGMRFLTVHCHDHPPWMRAICEQRLKLRCAARCSRNPHDSCCTSKPSKMSGSNLSAYKPYHENRCQQNTSLFFTPIKLVLRSRLCFLNAGTECEQSTALNIPWKHAPCDTDTIINVITHPINTTVKCHQRPPHISAQALRYFLAHMSIARCAHKYMFLVYIPT